MFRRSVLALCNSPSFRQQLIALKKQYRGAALYRKAQNEAKELFATIPKDVQGWVNEDNATAAVNGMGFFELEVPQKESIIRWTQQELPNFKSVKNIILASIGLLQVGQSQEQRDAMVSFITNQIIPRLRAELSSMSDEDFETTLKLLHRAKVTDENLWADICSQVVIREESLKADLTGSIRIFTVLARFATKNVVTETLCKSLLDKVAEMEPYDFSAFVSATEKLNNESVINATTTLPTLLNRIGHGAFSARDLAISFASCVRMFQGAATTAASLETQLHSVFERVKHRAKRHMNKDDALFWNIPRDIVAIAFAYESTSRLANRDFFQAFKAYVVEHISRLESHDLAMAVGILRRTDLLDKGVTTVIVGAITGKVADFDDDELSHVALCTTFVVGDQRLTDEVKKEAAKRTKVESISAALNFAACFGTAFPLEKLASDEVSSRQLVDLVTLLPHTHSLAPTFKKELERRLVGGHKNRITDADLFYLSRTKKGGVDVAATVKDRLGKPVGDWRVTTFDLLTVVTKDEAASFKTSALAAAKECATGPTTFLRITEALLNVYGVDDGTTAFLKKGSADLLNEGVKALPHIVAFLALTQRKEFIAIHPKAQWMDFFLYNVFSQKFSVSTFETLECVVTSLSILPRPLAASFSEAVDLIAARGAELASDGDAALAFVNRCKDLGCPLSLRSAVEALETRKATITKKKELEALEALVKPSKQAPTPPTQQPTPQPQTTDPISATPQVKAASPTPPQPKATAPPAPNPSTANATGFVSKFSKAPASDPKPAESKPPSAPATKTSAKADTKGKGKVTAPANSKASGKVSSKPTAKPAAKKAVAKKSSAGKKK